MTRQLSFDLMSGGTLVIDLATCQDCVSKACVEACSGPRRCGILGLTDCEPALLVTPEEAKTGTCIECLACEVACHLNGKRALTISLRDIYTE